MTSDHDTAVGELIYDTAVNLWRRAEVADAVQGLHLFTDQDIADATETELVTVQRWLDDFDGDRLVVGRDGETRTVKGIVNPAD